ncbi:MAG: glycosyltransferase family 2 protein [Oscillospiraceae bacterium]
MLELIQKFCGVVGFLLAVLYGYQVFYLVVGLLRRNRPVSADTDRLHRYAAVISARNEEAVIGELLASLRAQNYPRELLDLYVVADNCTDGTAPAARAAGARVYERFDRTHVGKGYAMDWLFARLREEGLEEQYDGYLIFDADNLVDPDFVREMNKVFDTGKYAAVTSYRNSKNFASNWISAGYALWFIREARFLNFSRMQLGTGCAVSGTGFLVSAAVIRANGGWPFHLLTEDIQFSVDCAVKGLRIGYCDKAVVYDEQPTGFVQSWHQRMRWTKGIYQVGLRYWPKLIGGCFTRKGGRFACFDMLMTVVPGVIVSAAVLGLNLFALAAGLSGPAWMTAQVLREMLRFLAQSVASYYIGLLAYGALTMLSERRQINAPAGKKLVYLLTFPLFMCTYIPISLAALVSRVEWKPIQHNAAASFQTARPVHARTPRPSSPGRTDC